MKSDINVIYFAVDLKYKLTISTKTEVIDGEEYLVISKVHSDFKSQR